jgi:glycosyltransferase involved in cell wall biosynthesis
MPKDKRKKILFVIPSLAGAGAERVLIYLLQYLDRNLFCPILVVFNETNAYVNQVPEDVVAFNLNKKGPLDFFRLISRLSKIIQREEPDLILSFLTYTNYLTLIATSYSGHKIPVVLTEHNTLSKSLTNERFEYIKKRIIQQFYPKAERIIAVSRGVKADLAEKYFPFPDRISVIYNSVDIEKIDGLTKEKLDHPWFNDDIPIIVSAGRLDVQKDYPLLLKTAASLRDQLVVRLIILGKGRQRKTLEMLAGQLGIDDNVGFMGFKTNPFKYIAKASIFVLSSSFEGFGNVIIEAMACGTPVISTRCPHGPDEIITNGVNGLLVPVGDVDTLAGAILRLLKDEPLRKRFAEEGRKRAEDFLVDKMVAEYERVFEEVSSSE